MTTPAPQGIRTETDGEVLIVTIDRPPARNAVDRPTADALYETFKSFDADDTLSVAILTGANGNFCAGADLKAVAEGRGNKSVPDGDYGPMGPSRLELSKPVIAAVDGYAVAGGLELACWCDLRVASPGAKFGVFCRRFGVPLIDGGTIRLPRLIGASRAMDMILTGREVGAEEALAFGLAELCIGGRLRASKSAGGRPKDRRVSHKSACGRTAPLPWRNGPFQWTRRYAGRSQAACASSRWEKPGMVPNVSPPASAAAASSER
jgi:enoyl-CoA hydratase/carnithine racemase